MKELKSLLHELQECDSYLNGQTTGEKIRKIAEYSAKRAIQIRRGNLIERLKENGLRLEEEI